MSDKPHIILITSTHWPYLRDISDLMFLKSGLGYRFRYTREYVSSELQNCESLINRKGYIVHANTRENPPEKDIIAEFLPIREVTIKEVKDFGKFIWLYFKLGNWVSYSDNDVGELNQYHIPIKNSTPPNTREKLFLTVYEAKDLKLNTIADDSSGESVDVTSNWIRIVNHMTKFETHIEKKPSYLRLLSITEKGCQNPLIPKEFSNVEDGYEFNSDKDYQIEVFQYNAHGVPDKPFPLILEVDEERIDPLVKEAIILGRYDRLILSFRPYTTIRSYGTFLKLELLSDSAMNLAVTINSRILRGWRQLIGALAVAAGIGLAGFPNLPQDIPVQTIRVIFAIILAFTGIYWGVMPRKR